MAGRRRTYLLILGALLAYGPLATGAEADECRFWGLIGAGYPDGLIADHLREGNVASLRSLAQSNPDGWGLGYFLPADSPIELEQPIIRRGGPPADHPDDPDYDLAVDELALLAPPAAIAHVRRGTSGHLGVPDPHPFLRPFVGRSVLFAHNGGLSVDGLEGILEGYLEAHPLDYEPGMGETGRIDSELYFVFLRKFVEEHPELDLTAALVAAVGALAANEAVIGDSARLNFVLTDGDTLYALHYYGEAGANPVHYYGEPSPIPEDVSDYWVVASEILGSDGQGWLTIPARTLGVFVPAKVPVFHAIAPEPIGAAPVAAATDATGPATAPDAPGGSVGRDASSPGSPPDHNCRFWGLVGSGYPASLIAEHLVSGSLANLREMGSSNDDGWGLSYYMPAVFGLPLNRPVARRGGPAAPADDDFVTAAYELRDIAPHAALGHVRLGTSGHTGIPDPHPFQHRGLIFAHNGVVSSTYLRIRLGDYLETYPPDYFEGFSGTGPVDSELYFLYLLKLIDTRPDLPFGEALYAALRDLSLDRDLIGDYPRLNFVLTDGDTLYALHYYGAGSVNAVHFFPSFEEGGETPSPFWVAASQPMGMQEEGWQPIPSRTLAVFVPGEAPAFRPLVGVPFSWIELEGTRDHDQDGWYSAFAARCDPNILSEDSTLVWVDVMARALGHGWRYVASSDSGYIVASEPDTFQVTCIVDSVDAGLLASEWDLKLTLRTAAGDSLEATPESHPDWGLADFPVESSGRDSVSDLERVYTFVDINRTAEVDEDGDGYLSAFDLEWSLDLSPPTDSALIYIEVLGGYGSTFFTMDRSDEYWIDGLQTHTTALPIAISPKDQEADTWDLMLTLYDAETGTIEERAFWSRFPVLDDVPVEGRVWDTAGWAGTVRPNPADPGGDTRFAIPLLIPEAGAPVGVEIWDVAGRLVWCLGPDERPGGELTIEWSGVDTAGRRLASGVYFGQVRVGARSWDRRFVLVR